VNSLRPEFYSKDFAGDALGFTDVLQGFVNWNAIRGGETWRQQKTNQPRAAALPSDLSRKTTAVRHMLQF